MMLSEIDVSIIPPAFVAGLLILSTHVPLGRHVISRGIIFIDLAIAQIAGLGVIAANSLGWSGHGFIVQFAAVSSALLAAILFSWTDKRWPNIQESLIGVCFVLAATGSILLLSQQPHGGEHLRELLVGQILWVDYQQLIPVAILSVLVLMLWFKFYQSDLCFYVLFAITITVSVQIVGVYLVFASLIIPALAVRSCKGYSLLCGYLIGAAGFALGLLVSLIVDVPSGPMIVWSLAFSGMLFALSVAIKQL